MRSHLRSFAATLGTSFLLAVPASGAQAVQPVGREIRMSLTGGVVFPSGSATERMESGPTVGGDIGIALSPRVTAGIRFDIGFLASKINASPSGIPTGDNRWMWYAGALFGEYVLVRSRLSPVVGGLLGVSGDYMSYPQQTNGSTGFGSFGMGYGGFVGLRYRVSQRLGGMFDISLVNNPGMSTGPYCPARMALEAFF